jgi:mannitol-1-/sugar-/sorbitol-6-phosphatase
LKTFECEAVLFDLDGVLVDSGDVVVRTWRKWSQAHGLDPQHTIEFAHGVRAIEVVERLTPHLDAAAEAAELERIEVEDLDGVRQIEGARELLESLSPDAWTVVTSGTRPIATGRLEYLGLPVPEHLVTASDVQKGKPHPEPYLRGAELLGVAPEQCVVVEDAPSGVGAARAAGMRVIAVATTYPVEDLSRADTIAGALTQIEVHRPSGDASAFELRVRPES